MKLFNKMKDPVFLKGSNGVKEQILKLNELEPLLSLEGQAIIKQDIRNLEYGIVGESTIAYELRNSHMPMYVLHDVYFEHEGLAAQIDYLVFTKKVCFVIECKNLYGNIEINSAGDFIRHLEMGGKKRKEGIYSPITQNQRHLDLIRKIQVEKSKNIILSFLKAKSFDMHYHPIVVLANPKTVLNAKYAKKEDKAKVIRADQLVNYMKDVYMKSKVAESTDTQLLQWAESFLKLHKNIEKAYTQKYDKYKLEKLNGMEVNVVNTEQMLDSNELEETESILASKTVEIPIQDTDIYKELRAYRLTKSREENIKAYIIYNDAQLEDLVTKMPTSLSSLEEVSGFGKVKVSKYGEDIVGIVNKFI